MEAMGNMLDVPTLAAKLMKNLFTEEERINSNTTGDHGKQVRPHTGPLGVDGRRSGPLGV